MGFYDKITCESVGDGIKLTEQTYTLPSDCNYWIVVLSPTLICTMYVLAFNRANVKLWVVSVLV